MGRSDWKTRGKVALKAVLAAVVIGFAGRHVARTWRDLASRGGGPRVDPSWFALGVVLYVAGLVAFGAFYARVMRSSPGPVGAWAAIRAYLISHLGKYVPGKAMVVVMRVGLVTPYGAHAAPAAFGTLYETLVMMATGGLVAALAFGLALATAPDQPRGPLTVPIPSGYGPAIDLPLFVLGFGLGLAFLLIAVPPVFPRLAAALSRRLRGVGPGSLPRLGWGLLGEGMAWAMLGWILLGMSQVAVIRAILPGGIAPGVWPLALASVALATVAGFAVPISPGGLGVREWVLWTALAATLDRDLAVVAALLLRLAWVAGELVAAAASAPVRPAAVPVPAVEEAPAP